MEPEVNNEYWEYNFCILYFQLFLKFLYTYIVPLMSEYGAWD